MSLNISLFLNKRSDLGPSKQFIPKRSQVSIIERLNLYYNYSKN